MDCTTVEAFKLLLEKVAEKMGGGVDVQDIFEGRM